MRPYSLPLVLGLLCATAAAQTPPEESVRRRADERAQSMREQIGQGHRLQSHVRVVVRLKNGNRLRGVVKDGQRIEGLRFVDADVQEEGAGVRLFYTQGARDYVFVPFRDFLEYRVLERLTPQQLEQLEKDLQLAEARRRAAAQAAPAAPLRAARGSQPAACRRSAPEGRRRSPRARPPRSHAPASAAPSG